MIYRGNRAAWAYIVARTKVMKSRLLKAEDFRKLLNMDFDEIVRYIGETEYKKEVDELGYKYSGPRLLDHALSANLARTYRKLIGVIWGIQVPDCQVPRKVGCVEHNQHTQG